MRRRRRGRDSTTHSEATSQSAVLAMGWSSDFGMAPRCQTATPASFGMRAGQSAPDHTVGVTSSPEGPFIERVWPGVGQCDDFDTRSMPSTRSDSNRSRVA